MTKLALVTGSNKGIGYAIVRGLCKQFDGHVYVTARDESRGQEALSKLKQEGLEPRFHQLDINDETSVNKLAEFVKEKYGGIDVLVNNAGIMYPMDSEAPVSEQAEVTIQTNFWGTMNVCRAMLPLLRPGARVVHLSSLLAASSYKRCSVDVRDKLRGCTTPEEVGDIMDTFVRSAKTGALGDWSDSSYGMSKVGVSFVTPLQQRQVDGDGSKDIVVNSCCPGYVSTNMTKFQGHKTIDEGADTPLYLALLPPNTDIRGKFVSGRKVKDWMMK